MSTSGMGPSFCARWTQWYTRRLPDEVGAQRRAEIASDLWEHGRDSREAGQSRLRHDLEVIRRTLVGVPSDLAWRWGVLRSQAEPDPGGHTMPHRLTKLADGSLNALVAIGIVPVVAIIPAVVDPHAWIWLLSALALGGALLAGLAVRSSRPITSTSLLVVGSAAPSVAFFWLPPVYLLTLAIAAAALLSIPDRNHAAPSLR